MFHKLEDSINFFIQTRGENLVLRQSILTGILGICLLVGCGSSEKGPELATVTGKVTVDGEAVSGGTIQFVPDSAKGTTGPSSTSEIQPDGSFTLLGPGGTPGAVIGSHKVVVQCPPDPGEVSGGDGQSGSYECKIPDKYGDIKSTDQSAEVQSGENTVNIELKSK